MHYTETYRITVTQASTQHKTQHKGLFLVWFSSSFTTSTCPKPSVSIWSNSISTQVYISSTFATSPDSPHSLSQSSAEILVHGHIPYLLLLTLSALTSQPNTSTNYKSSRILLPGSAPTPNHLTIFRLFQSHPTGSVPNPSKEPPSHLQNLHNLARTYLSDLLKEYTCSWTPHRLHLTPQ